MVCSVNVLGSRRETRLAFGVKIFGLTFGGKKLGKFRGGFVKISCLAFGVKFFQICEASLLCSFCGFWALFR